MTRAQLQNAPADLSADPERAIVRQQEVDGQLWAENVYKRVRETAQQGLLEYRAFCPDTLTSIGYSYGTKLLIQWFPDSEVTTVVFGALKNNAQKSLRISWADRPVTFDRDQRRHEKETSW
jgi:hypothetical protein